MLLGWVYDIAFEADIPMIDANQIDNRRSQFNVLNRLGIINKL